MFQLSRSCNPNEFRGSLAPQQSLIQNHHMLWWQFWNLCENQNDHCYHNVFPFQIVKLMKHIVSASSHVLGNKNVDEGEDFSFFSGLFTFYKLNCIPKLFGFQASVRHPQTLLLSFLNRDPEQCGHADETVCPAALCRLPSGCDLTSWRAAGQT